MNIEYEIIGNTIPFDKSAEMYNRSTYIGPADDGWSKIVKVDDQYYNDWCDVSELKLLYPEVDNLSDPANCFLQSIKNAEYYYFMLINRGWKPQQARQVLPNATKTELVMTGFESDWEHFFELRCSGAAHPDAKKLADELKSLMNVKNIELNSVK